MEGDGIISQNKTSTTNEQHAQKINHVSTTKTLTSCFKNLCPHTPQQTEQLMHGLLRGRVFMNVHAWLASAG